MTRMNEPLEFTGDLVAFRQGVADARPLKPGQKRWFQWDGKPRRAPMRGEAFISGAIPAVYMAGADLGIEYHIAVEMPAPAPCRCVGCPSAVRR